MAIGLLLTIYAARFVNPIVAAGFISISSILFVALLERLLPYGRDWNRSRGYSPTDLCHTFLHQILLSRGLNILYTLILVGAAAWLAERYGSSVWSHHWAPVLQLLLMLLIAEFGRYWRHRFSHRSPWLWCLHAVHHSPKAELINPHSRFAYHMTKPALCRLFGFGFGFGLSDR
ncbi:MAG: sterol desaturase/sphingolipid hydroxylase (fatty acid hydroxylase superfamily) [Zhongshania sp.]